MFLLIKKYFVEMFSIYNKKRLNQVPLLEENTMQSIHVQDQAALPKVSDAPEVAAHTKAPGEESLAPQKTRIMKCFLIGY